MFDQTIHGSKIRDSDSESDDESGSSDDEADQINAAPTPLPPSSMMMRPDAGMVPPTPTPAQGQPGRQMGPLTIFADENAGVPRSASKQPINVFSETPAKQPLVDFTPSAKPGRAFEVFQEEPNLAQSTPSAKRAPLGAVNIFATPAVGQRLSQRSVLSNAIVEENEEEEEEEAEAQAGREMGQPEEYININDEEDDMETPWRRRNGLPSKMLTPITERTCEFTQITQFSTLRSSQLGASTSRRESTASTGYGREDPDEAFVASQPTSGMSGLAPVTEEEERSGSLPPPDQPVFDRSSFGSPSANNSGTVDTGFHLPEGFTIHRQPDASAEGRTMFMVDDETTRTARESSADVDTDTGAFVTAPHGSFALPNPCNPCDDDVINELLSRINPPLSALPGFVDKRSVEFKRLETLQKYSKSKLRRSSGAGSRSSMAPEEGFALDLAGKAYEVREKIGEGGYGAVFLGIDVAVRQAMDDADSDEEDDDEAAADKSLVAIKVEKPSAVWEAVVLDRLHRVLDLSLRSSIIRSTGLYAFKDESYLLLDYSSQGTLLDIVNKATTLGIAPATAGAPSAVDELVAIFFTVELLRSVEGLHRAGFIHGDLKIDNCLVRLEEIPNSSWSTQYARDGSNGWSSKGVKLIDFGRAIDLSLFSEGGANQQFTADWKVDERDCVEMREGRPWSYQTDYSGLASVCYCLLYGKYIGTEAVTTPEGSKRYKIDQPLKRYWQADLWNPLFDTLLNPTVVRADGALPISDELASIRQTFETWLEANCQKGGKSLRSMLKKVELGALTARRV